MREPRQRIVAGNWKMNGSRHFVRAFIPALLEGLEKVNPGTEVVLVPPAVLVGDVRDHLQSRDSTVRWGLQNLSAESNGAFTGEISADMAKDQGCHYCILGHSERRQLFGETDDVIADKVLAALSGQLKVIVCVGETLSQRDAGEAEKIVSGQVKACLKKVPDDDWNQIVLAYEPVWAIGTGKTASAADAQTVHAGIRRVLAQMQAPANNVAILYGGSVKPDNAEELFSQPDIDGGLIGGASLDAESFAAICRAC